MPLKKLIPTALTVHFQNLFFLIDLIGTDGMHKRRNRLDPLKYEIFYPSSLDLVMLNIFIIYLKFFEFGYYIPIVNQILYSLTI